MTSEKQSPTSPVVSKAWESDKLNRKESADFLTNYLVNKFTVSKDNGLYQSFVININAEWGFGKTYALFLIMLRQKHRDLFDMYARNPTFKTVPDRLKHTVAGNIYFKGWARADSFHSKQMNLDMDSFLDRYCTWTYTKRMDISRAESANSIFELMQGIIERNDTYQSSGALEHYVSLVMQAGQLKGTNAR